jgi:hypothetical protein
LPTFSATNAPRKRLHLLFEHHKQWGPSPKTTIKPYLNCSNTDLPTLIYRVLFITRHLGTTYAENLNMSKQNLKNDKCLKDIFKNPSCKS